MKHSVISRTVNLCCCHAAHQEPRVVQLVSHPFLGQDVLRAGPSQFGLNLKERQGVSSVWLISFTQFVGDCSLV